MLANVLGICLFSRMIISDGRDAAAPEDEKGWQAPQPHPDLPLLVIFETTRFDSFLNIAAKAGQVGRDESLRHGPFDGGPRTSNTLLVRQALYRVRALTIRLHLTRNQTVFTASICLRTKGFGVRVRSVNWAGSIPDLHGGRDILREIADVMQGAQYRSFRSHPDSGGY